MVVIEMSMRFANANWIIRLVLNPFSTVKKSHVPPVMLCPRDTLLSMLVTLLNTKRMIPIPFKVRKPIILKKLQIWLLALLTQCTDFVRYLTSEKLFSILFFRRREGNRRGTPVRAALTWALIEETRLYLELQFNENVRICARPLRSAIMDFSGKKNFHFSRNIIFFLKTFQLLVTCLIQVSKCTKSSLWCPLTLFGKMEIPTNWM